MPYSVRKNFGSCSGYAVVKDGTSKIMGCHTSREKARSQIAALNASEGGYKPYHDDEEEDKKTNENIRIANSMVDSILGGLGFGGNAVMTIKNTILEYNKQNNKKLFY